TSIKLFRNTLENRILISLKSWFVSEFSGLTFRLHSILFMNQNFISQLSLSRDELKAIVRDIFIQIANPKTCARGLADFCCLKQHYSEAVIGLLQVRP